MEVKLQLLLQTLDGHNGVWSTRAMLVHPSTLTEEEWNAPPYTPPIQVFGRKSRLVEYTRVVSVDLPVIIGERNYITEKGRSLSWSDFSFEVSRKEQYLLLKYMVLDEKRPGWLKAIKTFRFSLPKSIFSPEKEACDE